MEELNNNICNLEKGDKKSNLLNSILNNNVIFIILILILILFVSKEKK